MPRKTEVSLSTETDINAGLRVINESSHVSGVSASRRKRRTKTQVGSSRAPMQELEHIVDALEHPPERPNPLATITTVVVAICTVAAILKAGASPDGYKLSSLDLILILGSALSAVVQVATFVSSLKKNAHHSRAVRYATDMLQDCKAQEAEESAEEGLRIATPTMPRVVTDEDVEPAEGNGNEVNAANR